MTPRSTAQRVADTKRLLEREEDAWVATAGADGTPHLVPLSHLWERDTLVLATPAASVTVRNLERGGGRVRVAVGSTRDVVVVVGTTSVAPLADETDTVDRFAARAGWDPRADPDCVLVRVVPERIQAWRDADELVGRTVMRDGVWLG